MFEVADRLKNVKVSASAAMTRKVRELRAQGVKIVGLSSGEPDFPTPAHAIEAAHQAALAGDTKYPPQDGVKSLKEAIQRKFKRDNNLDYALDEIMVSNGSKQIMYDVLMASVNPGDEVVIPAPGWISYADQAVIAGAKPVSVSCPENNQFKLRASDLEEVITAKTKWVVLNFPNNPTGAVCSPAEMRQICDVLLKHKHVMVMADDVYEHLIYGDAKFSTVAEVEPALKDRTLTVNGASKAYAMTGWRVGFAGGPRAMIAAMTNMQGQIGSGISTIGQAAATAALNGPQELLKERAADYQKRRDEVVAMLRASKGVTCHMPEGAFYVFPNIAGCIGKTTRGGRKITNDTDFVTALLEEKHVATVQGAAYGMSPYFRISYATDMASLRDGCTRIQEFCAELR
ncbi:pyridoxal phosphate-dependent aminotransferase [Reyranella sp. MMS21-HV4-11]|uniref:Pyridoxal phosphate-dependent aminotransferase n=1 Tax=Reyranella humidisoli TaxID=2849149 RepID=A0ABS6IJD0_9HYPH|nr:pyridoxal phosphate-dependent aminotransferase [Reyranella sp. MMS21-HV4-11]MBU8874416.1 pyridoxal phosphate-dependent aminotransferase [Reyranella sp. MMS21-HV4-11]